MEGRHPSGARVQALGWTLVPMVILSMRRLRPGAMLRSLEFWDPQSVLGKGWTVRKGDISVCL